MMKVMENTVLRMMNTPSTPQVSRMYFLRLPVLLSLAVNGSSTPTIQPRSGSTRNAARWGVPKQLRIPMPAS